MRGVIIFLIIGLNLFGCSKIEEEVNVKTVLLELLKNTHTNQNWFVPINTAIAGLSPEQVIWKDSSSNNSIIENVGHIIFWNERVLKAFKQEELADFNDNNELTFRNANKEDWNNLVQKLDRIQTEWMQVVEMATDKQLKEWHSEILNMAAHNAYHTGQIIYIRKQNGWWK